MKNILKIVNKYIVISTPLILYTLLTNLYLLVSAHGNLINLLIAFILFLAMTVAFVAGWGKMIKNAVIKFSEDVEISFMKTFTEGVGEYLVPCLLAMLNIIIIALIILTIDGVLGIKFIGDPKISMADLNNSLQNPIMMKQFLLSLTHHQLRQLFSWNALILISYLIMYFGFMLYLPALFLKEKNAYKALWISWKDLFSKKILQNIGIFVAIISSYLLFSIFSTVCSVNPILLFVATLLNFYYLTIVAVGIFYYYYKNFVKIDCVVG